MRAVSSTISAPYCAMKSKSPVASRYRRIEYAMSALMWYWALPAGK
jgi:hypothetical protein